MQKKVQYKGEILILTRFWGNNELCLWITKPEQISMPKMEFVGGYPDGYCIFLKNLTRKEKEQITDMQGIPLVIDEV